ncbi:DUF1659 domain-containing protein [Clostridium sp. CM028]|uniref:DUF1659 domain-containing protein n=1 Tax=unclassified Clostridium TaxID=2614128 RepID=UPI001C6E95EF|nr:MULTISPECIES: DUF1659 domain-containing protein [unclassified Clostridium]MBW9146851.1 DUF1659 domain-containing protein [Clostridium sp. CM027]MBW9150226.1 DUF1659 domain-containing protein [Clostridium sp. CM028]UVE42830.1 DUF1659 domain-containing protein [Clostridium sp. CM027]WLC63480.1 DUF1659 domain-containing protein [Clostridium sp. CM028]
MAVVSTKVASALKLTMKVGVDIDGNDKFATKTLGNLKVTANDEDIFAIGKAISNIKTYPLFTLDRQDQSSLVME